LFWGTQKLKNVEKPQPSNIDIASKKVQNSKRKYIIRLNARKSRRLLFFIHFCLYFWLSNNVSKFSKFLSGSKGHFGCKSPFWASKKVEKI